MSAGKRKLSTEARVARNCRIVSLQGEGLSSAEIAERMGVTSNTVNAVLHKLGLKATGGYPTQREMQNEKVGLPSMHWRKGVGGRSGGGVTLEPSTYGKVVAR